MKSPTPTLTAQRAGAELERLAEAREHGVLWRKWGPYLSERQWGTVREDYSENGDAWNYFSHDQARSRAYRWGEDGLAGFSDDHQRLCFALSLWNGKDPILKERLFGLTNSEGNHGEEVKEYYFYLDATPSHSYMKWLYKYPQRAYPYVDLVETNRAAPATSSSTNCSTRASSPTTDTSTCSSNTPRRPPRTCLSRSRSPTAGRRRQCSTCCRPLVPSTWSPEGGGPKPLLRQTEVGSGRMVVAAPHPELGERFLYCEGSVPLLFTENETNHQRLFGSENRTPYVKDGINDYVVHGSPGRGQPGAERNQGRRPLSRSAVPARGQDRNPPASNGSGAQGADRSGLRRPFRCGNAGSASVRRMSSISPSRRPPRAQTPHAC